MTDVFDQFDPDKVGTLAAAPPPPRVPRHDAFSAFDPFPDEEVSGFDTRREQAQTSTAGAFLRGAERSLIPSIGALPAIGAGATLGAEVGAPFAPFTFGLSVPGGALIGGAAGGLGAGYVLGKAQDWALSKLPESWVEKIGLSERQQKLDEEHHGVASFLGGLAPYAVTMRPGGFKGAALPENATALQRIMAHPLTSRVFGGGIMGGLELGQELAHGEGPDWTKVAISTGFGVVFNQPTRIGQRLENVGARPVRRMLGLPEPAAATPAAPAAEPPPAGATGAPSAEPAAAPPSNVVPLRPDLTAAEAQAEILNRDRRGVPHLTPGEAKAATVADAADLGVMGPGTTEETFHGSHQRSADAEESARLQKQVELSVIGEPPKTDVHSLARQMHLELFNEYDRLQSQRAEFAKAAEEGGNAQAKQHLATTDAALDKIRPEVQAAYRRAAEAGGHETVAPEPPPSPAARTIEEQRDFIKSDVTRQLVRAGRPREEAEAAAALIAARYETRAALFKGARGTAEDLYRSEGAEILGPGMRPQQPVVQRPSVPRSEEHLSLVPFLARRGGISPSDPLASDLRSILGDNSRIFKEGGMTLDRAREAAAEAGYIANEGRGGTENRGGGTSTVRDLLDAVSQESRGRRVYRPGMEPRGGKVEGREPTPEEIEEASRPLDPEPESELMTEEDREALAGALELSQKVRPNLDVKDDGTQIHVQPKDMQLPDWAKPYKWGITAYRGMRNGRQAIYIRDSRLPEEAQGKGYGVAMYEELAELAEQEGLPFESDATVTKQATLMWAALKRRGYDVQTAKDVNPVEGPPEAPHLGRYETSDGGPVFWIGSDRQAAGLELLQPARPEASATIAGVRFEGTIAQLEQLKAARRAGEGRDEIQRLVDQFREMGDAQPQATSAASGRSVRDRIVDAYLASTGGKFNASGDLASIRKALPDVPRNELDAELLRMQRANEGVLYPNDNKPSLTQADRDAAIRVGGEPAHILWIERDPRRELEQPARGGIKLNPTGAPGRDFIGVPDVKPILRLTRDANASTFIHESGHQFLGELLRDAEHEAAPDQLKADAKTALDWVGAKSAEDLQVKRHEKFARGFEQYLREGTAPSAGLARVFAQFRQWLLNIYQTIKGLGQPINEDIRGVFDRMLAEEPQRTVVAPEREAPPSHADVWEADARAAEPHHADATEARVAHEQETRYADNPHAREIEDALARFYAEHERTVEPGTETSPGAGGPREVHPGGEPPGIESRGGGGGQSASPGSAGAARPAGQGNRVPGQPGGQGEAGSQRAHLGDVPLAPHPAADLAGRDTFNVGKNGNVRTENITSIDQFAAAIEEAKDRIGGTDEPMTDGQVMDAAQSMGFDPSELTLDKLARSFGGIKDLNKKVLAFRMAVRDQAEIVGDLMRRIKDTDDDALVKEYARERERFDMFMSVLSSVTTEWGRAGRSFRNLEGWDEVRNVALTEQIKSRTGRTLFQLKMEAKLGAQIDTPAKVAKFLRDAQKRSFGGMVMEYFINNLISGPATHATYMVGNKLTMFQDAVPETLLASAIGAARRAFGRQGERVYAGEAWQQVKAVGANLPKSLQGAIEAVRTGQPTLLPGQTARPLTPFYGDTALNLAKNIQNDPVTWHEVASDFYGAMKGIRDGLVGGASLVASGGHAGAPIVGAHWSPLGQIPDIAIRGVPAIPVGSLVRLPGRAVSAIHSMDTIANYSRYIAARAYREAAELGLDGTARNQHIATRTQNPPEEWMEAGHKEAYAQTLMGEGGNFVKRLSALINTAATVPGLGQIRPLKFIDPFVHIGANVINQAVLKRTPLGIFSEEIRNDLLGKNGNVAQDFAQARMLAGTAMAIGFGSLAMEGYVTGSGPSDPKEAAAWREVYQPHSVRIGDMWYQVNRLGPMGMHLGIAADLYEVARDISEGDALTAAAHLQHAITQNILDESFMRGPSELIKALDDPGRYGEAHLKNFAASFVPFSVGVFQMNRAADPYTRQARTVMDSIMQRLPGQSVYLQPKVNVWGEDVPSPDAFGHAGLTAIYMKHRNSDPVRQAMLDLGVAPAPVPKTIRNVDLTDQEYTDFARTAGRMAKMRLDTIVRSPDWRRWPNHLRHDVIAEVVKQSREAARGWMMGRYPHIVRDAVEDLRERKTGEPEPIR